ncbi:unnamed protein product [Callosobruchus maculatus]|uniref:DUF4817 domain-containing protein n=1 Tax=Callosobruchus maculatus TaxID=64391 RepID=A0A653DHF5_CALMS|nr:unnamed protein product [Callosobruchus maculatus]
MQKFTVEERVAIVELYFEHHRSTVETQRAFRRRFNVRNALSAMTIRNLIVRFRQQGSVADLPRAGRPRSARTEENIEHVEVSIEDNEETSVRRRCTQLGLSRSSLHRILKHLRMFAYKIQLVHQLRPIDFRQRTEFAIGFQQLCREENDFLNRLIMSDEAHFHLNGFINKHNSRFWGTENPRVIHERELHPIKCTVWCGVTSQCIIGPFFFEDEDGNAETVTGERYRDMLQTFLQPALENMPEMCFQQDGATAHTARATMALLREIFGHRIISRNSDIPYPARSPDLTAPDFFLWGYLKERVYANKPRTLDQLKQNIRNEIRILNPQMLAAVMQNLCKMH